MKAIIIAILLVCLLPLAFSLSNPISLNGNTYYVVNSADQSEDTGDEVCGKAGLVCNGYTDTTNAACQQAHPNAATGSYLSGDASGVYCDGAPQSGLCAGLTNTCATCPTCTTSVQCNQPIGGLYNEMYVECIQPTATQQCKIAIGATTAQDLFTQIPGINQQLQSCQQKLPSGTGALIANGVSQIDVTFITGVTRSMYMTVAKGVITQLTTTSPGKCKQKTSLTEAQLNGILQSSNGGGTVANLIGSKQIKLTACNFWSGVRLFFVNPFVTPVLQKQAPTPPPPKPAPNCGQVGEQCNNRGCFSGICGSQKTQNSYGQWGNWNYECLDQQQYDTLCVGRGNSPAPWSCLTGICS